MKRRDLLIRLGLLGGAAAGAWWFRDNILWRGPAVTFANPVGSRWLDYAHASAITPTVSLSLNGRPTRALVDSGAQYSVMDAALYEALGLSESFALPMLAYGVSGQAQVGRGATVDVEIGGMRVDGLRTAILDLGPIAAEEGLAAPFVIGQDVLRHLVLEVDPRRRRVRFLPSEGWTPAPDLHPIAARRAGTALETLVTVEGTEVAAVVDTGASALLSVMRQTAQDSGLMDGRPRTALRSVVLGGVVAAESAVARTVTLGERLIRDVPVAIYEDVAVQGFPKALVGMGAFQEGTLVLDLGGGRLMSARSLDLTISGG